MTLVNRTPSSEPCRDKFDGASLDPVGGFRWCEDVGEYWKMCELAAEAAAEQAELEVRR